jgi:hypothetical protein
MLSAAVADHGQLVTSETGHQAAPWTIERAMRSARQHVSGLPGEFRIHDLRHYYESKLIASGLHLKVGRGPPAALERGRHPGREPPVLPARAFSEHGRTRLGLARCLTSVIC